MFCWKCGRPVDEGKAFCKECGARLTPDTAEDPQRARNLGRVPPPPAPSNGSWRPPSGDPVPGRGARRSTGLIVGIAAAVIVVLAGAGTGAYLLLRGGEETAVATTPASSTTITGLPDVSSGTSLAGATGPSTGDITATSQTIPELGASTTIGSDGAGSSADETLETYLAATDALVDLLVAQDRRIPDLAQEINDTAPKVPRVVWDELQSMMGRLDGSFTRLASLRVPRGFEESQELLGEAAMAMGNRIDATIKGIEAMWESNKIESAAPFFDLGRQARDEYREMFRAFQEVFPGD